MVKFSIFFFWKENRWFPECHSQTTIWWRNAFLLTNQWTKIHWNFFVWMLTWTDSIKTSSLPLTTSSHSLVSKSLWWNATMKQRKPTALRTILALKSEKFGWFRLDKMYSIFRWCVTLYFNPSFRGFKQRISVRLAGFAFCCWLAECSVFNKVSSYIYEFNQ